MDISEKVLQTKVEEEKKEAYPNNLDPNRFRFRFGAIWPS